MTDTLRISLVYLCAALSSFCFAGERITITAAEYGQEWSFTVSQGELECISNAVLLHTEKGTYAINGKAMSRYQGKYPDFRQISKPHPGLNGPKLKLPPPPGLIQRGLELCK